MNERIFTAEELRQYDGKEGRPAYFACQGIVHDATQSRLWREGTHVRRHQAGNDLTADLAKAPHGLDSVQRLPVVGRLAEGSPSGAVAVAADVPAASPSAAAGKVAAGSQLPGSSAPAGAGRREESKSGPPIYADLLYRMHAHPASVHFPIALCAVASGLHLLAFLFDCPVADTVALWNLVLGLLSSPLPIFSGFVDWRHQFGGRPTQLFVAKIALSLVFVVTGALVLALHFGTSGQPALLYHLLYLSFAPQVLALGFIGGRLTFPT